MRSVMLAAVHNGELEQSPAQEVLNLLLSAGLTQEVFEVVDQPELLGTVDTNELVSWRHAQRHLERQWRKHLKRDNPLRNVAAALNEGTYRLRLRLDSQFRTGQWRTRQIERFVTAKHIRAWRKFIKSPHSTLVVIESDATLTPESRGRVKSVLLEVTSDQPTYVNLAGGLSRSDIAIGSLAAGDVNCMTVFSRPVTNTSCSYVLNRSLVVGILSFLDELPEAATLGIDWLFNAFFVNQTVKGNEVRCLHSQPPALLHGSLTGVTRSWHPDR